MALLLATVLVASLSVPFVEQKKDTCGAAALAMVMAYWDAPADHDRIAAELLSPELRGIPGSRLAEFARAHGLQAIAYEGDLGQLREYLAKGRPLIVAWDMGRGRFHNVVVVGAGATHLVVHDPARGAFRRVREREFERRWRGAGHWTLLVLRSAG